MDVITRIRSVIRSIADTDNAFARSEAIRVSGLNCRANIPACSTRGQGLYELKHGRHAMPFERLPRHVRQTYEAAALEPRGYAFRGNNSAYKVAVKR